MSDDQPQARLVREAQAFAPVASTIGWASMSDEAREEAVSLAVAAATHSLAQFSVAEGYTSAPGATVRKEVVEQGDPRVHDLPAGVVYLRLSTHMIRSSEQEA